MLVTLADTKSYLNIASDDTTYDDIITGIINSVSKQFDVYTDRTLEASDYTLQIDGNGLEHIFLQNYPINSITSIHIDTDRVFGDDTAIDSANYVYYSDSGEIALVSNSWWGGIFPRERQCIKIVCNLGYTVSDSVVDEVTIPATIPYDLVKACKDQVKYLYRKWQNNEEGTASYSTINNSISLVENTAIIKLVSQTLDKYVSRYHGCI